MCAQLASRAARARHPGVPAPLGGRLRVEGGVVRDRDRRIAPHRRDLEVAAQVAGALLHRETLARRQLGGVGDDALEIAVAPQQLGGRLLADAGRSGDVVRGIAAQRDQGGDLLGLDPVALAHAGAIDALEHAARARVQHRGRVGDELVHVAIARDDERARLRAPPRASPRSRAGRPPRRAAPSRPRSRTPRSGPRAGRAARRGRRRRDRASPGSRAAARGGRTGVRASRQTSTARGCVVRHVASSALAKPTSRPTGRPPAPSTSGMAWYARCPSESPSITSRGATPSIVTSDPHIPLFRH